MKMVRCFCLLLPILLGSCDTINMTEEDMQKYPELLPFVLDNTDFEGKHEIDLGQVTFSYDLSLPLKNAFDTIDAIAISRNWRVTKISSNERLYLKAIKDFPADVQEDSLLVVYSTAQSRLTFNWR